MRPRTAIALLALLGSLGTTGCLVVDRNYDNWHRDERRWECSENWRDYRDYRQQRRWWWERQHRDDHDHDDD